MTDDPSRAGGDDLHRFRVEVDPADFDLVRCVQSGQTFRWEETAPDVWRGGDGPTAWVAERRPGRGGVVGWDVASNAPREAFERYFRLDWDGPAVRQAILDAAPELAPFLGFAPGHRLMRPADPLEVLAGFVCTSNNHLPRIRAMVRRLEGYGSLWPNGLAADRRAFPTLGQLGAADEATLRAAGFGYRGRFIPQLAAALTDRGGEAWLADLRQTSTPDLRRELRALPGVGPKVADCVALFAYDRGEVVPVDTHVWRIAHRTSFPHWRDEPLTAARYEAVAAWFAERWGPLAGWAHQALFVDSLARGRSR